MISIIVDDIRRRERVPIHVRLEQKRRGFRRHHLPRQIIIHFNDQRPRTMFAFGRDPHAQLLLSKASLHEGRCKRILRSSPRYFLPGGKLEVMRRPLRRHWKRPTYIAVRVAHKKQKVLFELSHDTRHAPRIDPRPARNFASR